MNFANTLTNSLTAVVFLASAMAVAPKAQAVAIYGADALVQVSLSDVRGGTLGTDAIATYQNQVSGTDATATGQLSWAVADPYLFPGQPVQPMQLSDTLEHDHIAIGEAGGASGTAFSLLQSDGYIYLENQAGAGPIFFDFDYSIQSTVNVGVAGAPKFADAFANSIIEIFDDNLSFVNIAWMLNASLASGVLNDSINKSGTFTIALGPGQSSNISVLVDTSGGATYVPEPGTMALVVSGLIGIGVRRRARAA